MSTSRKSLFVVSILVVFGLALAACSAPAPPAAEPVAEEKTSTMLETRELTVEGSDAILSVRVAGNHASSNVMIALHGGPGQSHHYMLDLERLAGGEFAVVTYDQRGVGGSTAPPADPTYYELADYVEDLEAVRRAVGADQVHLLGHSWGGIVAMQYAMVYPEKVRSLILVGSGSPTWDGMMAAAAGIEQRVRELQEQGVLPDPLPPGAEFVAYFSDPSFPIEHPDENAAQTEFHPTVNQLTLSVIEGFDFSAEVGRLLDHRVQVLYGEDDPAGKPLVEETLAALRSADVEYVLLERCGHFWHECPDQFYPRVRAFLGLAENQEGASLCHERTRITSSWRRNGRALDTSEYYTTAPDSDRNRTYR
jgi:pimeloyl-ACP methyl ester carboxylesterase